MSRILMFSHLQILSNEKAFGPSIRLWEIAKALQKRGHEITIVEKDRKKKEIIENIKIIEYDSKTILKNIKKNYDVAFIQIWFNDRDFLEKLQKIPIIVDIYPPYLLEHIYYGYDLEKKDSFLRFVDDILIPTLIPLQYGDYFICADEKQRKYYLGKLAALGRINPYNKDKELIGIVPYGLKIGKPKGDKKILKKIIPENKKIILWLSTFFPWFDPLKTAKIIFELTKINDEYVLAVVGAKNPCVNASLYNNNYKKFYEYVQKKKLLNKKVFIFDWIEYHNVENIYNESSLFIATYNPKSLETEFSYRVRTSEALWGRLPVICSGGDTVSEYIKKHKMGIVIEDKNEKEIAYLISKLSAKDMKKMKWNIEKFLSKLYWSKLIEPLNMFCNKPSIDKSKSKFLFNDILERRRDLIIQLRKEIENREYFIRTIKAGCKKEIDLLTQLLNERDVEINMLRYQIEKLEKLKVPLKEFKNSIVYPFYRITHTIGETKVGKILQKILK